MVHHALVHRDVGVAGHAEQAGLLHGVLAEDRRRIMRDEFLDKGVACDVAFLCEQHTLELVADGDDAIVHPVRLGIQLNDEIDLFVAQKRERVALVDDLRAEDREYLPLKVRFPEMLLLFVQLVKVHLAVAFFRQRLHQMLPVFVALGLQLRHARRDGRDLLRGGHMRDDIELVVFQQRLVVQ